jgi:general secretion pathway protein M
MSGFDRERHLKPLIVAAILLILLCGYWFYSSYRLAISRVERKTTIARNELSQFRESLVRYRALESELKDFAPHAATAVDSNLIAKVENATQQVGARSQLLYVRPQPDKVRGDIIEEGVEIKLEKLQLQQLVELLYQFDSTQQRLTVSQLRIRPRFDMPEQLDTVMTLSHFKEQR